MIGKNEQLDDECTKDEPVKLSETIKILEDTSSRVKEEVRLCFEQLAQVLKTRERQLLRQIEAVHNQQLTIVQSNSKIPHSLPSIRINLSERQDLEESIFKFGEFSSSERNAIVVRDAEPYKIEDYVEANRDHVTLDKSIKSNDEDETSEKFDYSPESPCDLSLNTSSEADVTAENEITVLMNKNYIIDEATDEKNVSSNIDNEELHDNSPKWELKIIAQTIPSNEVSDVPENMDNRNLEKFNDFTKDNYDKSEPEKNSTFTSYNVDSTLANLTTNDDVTMANKKTQDSEKHPKQIQQWLQEILVETETEPTIHEIEQFAEISKSRFKEFQFPLET